MKQKSIAQFFSIITLLWSFLTQPLQAKARLVHTSVSWIRAHLQPSWTIAKPDRWVCLWSRQGLGSPSSAIGGGTEFLLQTGYVRGQTQYSLPVETQDQPYAMSDLNLYHGLLGFRKKKIGCFLGSCLSLERSAFWVSIHPEVLLAHDISVKGALFIPVYPKAINTMLSATIQCHIPNFPGIRIGAILDAVVSDTLKRSSATLSLPILSFNPFHGVVTVHARLLQIDLIKPSIFFTLVFKVDLGTPTRQAGKTHMDSSTPTSTTIHWLPEDVLAYIPEFIPLLSQYSSHRKKTFIKNYFEAIRRNPESPKATGWIRFLPFSVIKWGSKVCNSCPKLFEWGMWIFGNDPKKKEILRKQKEKIELDEAIGVIQQNRELCEAFTVLIDQPNLFPSRVSPNDMELQDALETWCKGFAMFILNDKKDADVSALQQIHKRFQTAINDSPNGHVLSENLRKALPGLHNTLIQPTLISVQLKPHVQVIEEASKSVRETILEKSIHRDKLLKIKGLDSITKLQELAQDICCLDPLRWEEFKKSSLGEGFKSPPYLKHAANFLDRFTSIDLLSQYLEQWSQQRGGVIQKVLSILSLPKISKNLSLGELYTLATKLLSKYMPQQNSQADPLLKSPREALTAACFNKLRHFEEGVLAQFPETTLTYNNIINNFEIISQVTWKFFETECYVFLLENLLMTQDKPIEADYHSPLKAVHEASLEIVRIILGVEL